MTAQSYQRNGAGRVKTSRHISVIRCHRRSRARVRVVACVGSRAGRAYPSTPSAPCPQGSYHAGNLTESWLRTSISPPKWLRAIEYLAEDRRGFREERGCHNTADPRKEQRYSYPEPEDDGPRLPGS